MDGDISTHGGYINRLWINCLREETAAVGRSVMVLFLLAVGLWLTFSGHSLSLDDIPELVEGIRRAGFLAPVAFVVSYILAVVLMLPASLWTISGGLIFGTAWGAFLSLVGASTGAMVAFLLARYVAHDWIQSRVPVRFKKKVAQRHLAGWQLVAVIRLVPLIPFNIVNYALGLTTIAFEDYGWATVVFIAPGVFVYSAIGSLGEPLIQGNDLALARQAMLALCLLGLLVLLGTLVARRLERHG